MNHIEQRVNQVTKDLIGTKDILEVLPPDPTHPKTLSDVSVVTPAQPILDLSKKPTPQQSQATKVGKVADSMVDAFVNRDTKLL